MTTEDKPRDAGKDSPASDGPDSTATGNGAPGRREVEPVSEDELPAAARKAKDDGAKEDEAPRGLAASARIEVPKLTPAMRVLRGVYWLIWFLSVPLVCACLVVWALTPPSGIEEPGVLGWIQSGVREQPVPVGIGVFALVEMAIGAVRRRLPLARYAYPPLRPDIPEKVRGLFERGAALLDEADVIYATHDKAIVRELSVKERTRLRQSLEGLRDSMRASPFEEEAFVDALARADGEVDVYFGRWRKSEAREFIESILLAVGVALLLRTFVVEAFKIPSSSMVPTLLVGDHIFVNKFSYGPGIPYTHSRIWTRMPPDRGDVIVFAYPENMEQDFIKRVIALPGDKLETKDGHPVINGWEVPSCLVGAYAYDDTDTLPPHHEGDLFVEFLGDESYLTFYDRAKDSQANKGPFYVQPNEIYVMGDNRNNSHDSRAWFGGKGGGVPYPNIKGRALFVWLSYRDTGVDWRRFGTPVMGRPRAPEGFGQLQSQVDKCLHGRPPISQTTPPPPSAAPR